MPNIKVMVSLHPEVLEALDKLASANMETRSALVQRILRENADLWEILEGMKEAKTS